MLQVTRNRAERRLCALFSSSPERSGRVTMNVLRLDVRSARYVRIAYFLARSDRQLCVSSFATRRCTGLSKKAPANLRRINLLLVVQVAML
jgi:hypothetical protein